MTKFISYYQVLPKWYLPRNLHGWDLLVSDGVLWVFFQFAKTQQLGDYEVRSWTGWHPPCHFGPGGEEPSCHAALSKPLGGLSPSFFSPRGWLSGYVQGGPCALRPAQSWELRAMVWRLLFPALGLWTIFHWSFGADIKLLLVTITTVNF